MKKNLCFISVVALLPILAYSVYKMLKAKKTYLGSIKYQGNRPEKVVLIPDNNNLQFDKIKVSLQIEFDRIFNICITYNNKEQKFDVIISGYRNGEFTVQDGWMSDGGQE